MTNLEKLKELNLKIKSVEIEFNLHRRELNDSRKKMGRLELELLKLKNERRCLMS